VRRRTGKAIEHGPNVWVIRCRRGYSIKEEGRRCRLVLPVPQRLAIRIARLIAQANHSELIVQNRHGRIRLRDSHGFDPHPPRG